MMRKLFHFLGSLPFALILISVAALVVTMGTFLEARYESHLVASRWIYSHPLFAVLLGFFFINILFSALRRWPFKKRHIPFLVTHIGLLMVIAGTILKNQYGTQGHMILTEGSGGQHIILPNQYALQIEKKGSPPWHCPLCLTRQQNFKNGDLQVKVLGTTPHVEEKLETWIKGPYAYLSGLPRLPVHKWKKDDPLPLPFQVWLRHEEKTPWNILAIRTDDLPELLQKAYFHELSIQPEAQAALDLNYVSDKGFQHPTLTVGSAKIALQGEASLYNDTFDLMRSHPLLILTEDRAFAFDSHGRVYCHPFPTTNLIVYEGGFGGYTTQLTLPFPAFPCGKKEKEEADFQVLATQLKEAHTLSPPLQLLKRACDKQGLDFATTFLDFMRVWHASGSLLMPNQKKLEVTLEWDAQDLKACQWISLLFDQLAGEEDLMTVLQTHKWPFIADLKMNEDIPTQLAGQLFACANSLPPVQNISSQARLLSAYLKAYGIDYHALHPILKGDIENFSRYSDSYTPLVLEAPVTPKHSTLQPLTKLEDNRPRVFLEVKKDSQKQILSLAYDPQGNGLKWPILNGEYTIRFQPRLLEIPYRIRLRQARQINYANSNQPYSYESDIWIDRVEKTLTMNKVHETWDGYRFYLAGMSATTSGIKRAQLVVNQDPVKYYVTYPGGMIVALGIVLLFWLRPYKK